MVFLLLRVVARAVAERVRAATFSLREMDCCQQAWDEFMLCPMAQETMVPIMDAGAGRYFNVIALSGRRPQ